MPEDDIVLELGAGAIVGALREGANIFDTFRSAGVEEVACCGCVGFGNEKALEDEKPKCKN